MQHAAHALAVRRREEYSRTARARLAPGTRGLMSGAQQLLQGLATGVVTRMGQAAQAESAAQLVARIVDPAEPRGTNADD